MKVLLTLLALSVFAVSSLASAETMPSKAKCADARKRCAEHHCTRTFPKCDKQGF